MQTIKAERLARDLETMMNVVNSDPGHIARAKAKRTRVMRAAAEPKNTEARQADFVFLLHICTLKRFL